MEPATGARPRAALRNLDDPVRSFADAVGDLVRGCLAEFNNPATSRRRRTEVGERLRLIRSIVGEDGYAQILDRASDRDVTQHSTGQR